MRNILRVLVNMIMQVLLSLLQNNKRTLAITGLRFAVDDIMNTLFLVEPDGSINYNNIQAFSSADYAFIFSFAQKLKETKNKNIQFGVNAKVIHRSVGKFAKAWGFGFDAGMQISRANGNLAFRQRYYNDIQRLVIYIYRKGKRGFILNQQRDSCKIN